MSKNDKNNKEDSDEPEKIDINKDEYFDTSLKLEDVSFSVAEQLKKVCQFYWAVFFSASFSYLPMLFVS
jgi:hypothetical protein